MPLSPLVTLVLSIVFGAAALLGTHLWLNASPDESDQQPAPVEVQKAPVLVATRDIPRGTNLSPAWFNVEERIVDAVPRGAFGSVEALEASGEDRRTLINISAGDVLSEPMLLAPGMRASLSAKIQPGYRAFTIRTTDVSGVGGFVLPGDRVDVIFTEDATPQSTGLSLVSNVLLQNVEVLGVDLNDDMTGEETRTFETATLAVALDEAQRLSVASQSGTLSLALRGSADEAYQQAEAVRLREEKPEPRQVAAVRPQPATPREPDSSTIEVILGEQVNEHTVPVSH
ncbi:Flp pilus assembly protein CpaB [Henriciella sp.]|uniref:Flp pilus assembly protein CpaB n=1 Tax=Henriciella sp. TaxID=1968823 RepID=UPI0026108A15|nr:Flp pilus assembly protein CpaB [Henriciella sp.]